MFYNNVFDLYKVISSLWYRYTTFLSDQDLSVICSDLLPSPQTLLKNALGMTNKTTYILRPFLDYRRNNSARLLSGKLNPQGLLPFSPLFHIWCCAFCAVQRRRYSCLRLRRFMSRPCAQPPLAVLFPNRIQPREPRVRVKKPKESQVGPSFAKGPECEEHFTRYSHWLLRDSRPIGARVLLTTNPFEISPSNSVVNIIDGPWMTP